MNILSDFFEEVAKGLTGTPDIKLASNYLTSDVLGILLKVSPAKTNGGVGKLKPDHLIDLISMIRSDKLSSRGAKDALAVLVLEGGDLDSVIKKRGLIQESSQSALTDVAKRILKDNPSVVRDYKKGKTEVLQYLVGQGMKETRGSANPKMLQELFTKLLR